LGYARLQISIFHAVDYRGDLISTISSTKMQAVTITSISDRYDIDPKNIHIIERSPRTEENYRIRDGDNKVKKKRELPHYEF
jgi:hypothetical protein